MGDGYERTFSIGKPEHQVGKGQIRDDLPVANEQVKPVDLFRREGAVGGDEIAHGGHRTRVVRQALHAGPPCPSVDVMSSAVPVTLPWPSSPTSDPLVIGHRGACGDAPENTMGSFHLAAAHQATLIETDIQISSDGVPFLLHDDTLTRTTDAEQSLGLSSDALAETLPWTDLRSLDAGSWFGSAFAGERVPHLDDLAMLHEQPAQGSAQVGFDLEIKPPITHSASHVVSVVDAHLRSAAWAPAVASGQVVVTSFDPEVVELAASTLPVPVGLLLGAAPDPADLATLASSGIAAMVVDHAGLTQDVVDAAGAAGLAVWVYTANEIDDWNRLVSLGVGGICTDYPAALQTFLAHRKTGQSED